MIVAVAALFLGWAVALLAMLGAVDQGLLDRQVAAWASGRLGRNIAFRELRIRMLSRHPEVDIRGLRIANPAGFGPDAMLTASSVHADLRPWALLFGRTAVRSLRIEGASLSLVRLGPDRNNWVTPHHRHGLPAFEPLRALADFQVHDGRLRFRDLGRHLDIRGRFEIGTGSRPFRFAGAGQFLGAAIAVSMMGGPLHGAAVGPPYPFSGKLQDGATHVEVSGTSVQPFDLSGYRLRVRSDGPNLADLGYLFHLVTPNSAPFQLSALASAAGGEVRVDQLVIATGHSHVGGTIWSDHRQPRRDILADLHATSLHRDDIDAMLAQLPSRLDARDRSGAVGPGPRSRFLISDAPLGLARLRATDLDFRIQVDRLLGYPLAFQNIATRLDLDHGVLAMPTFRATLFGGAFLARGRIDARAERPSIAVSATMRGLRLSQFPAAKTRPASGSMDGDFDLAGRGRSFHAAAADGQGHLQIRFSDLAVPKAAEWMLAGDLVRAATASIGGGRDPSSLSLAAGPFSGSHGLLVTDRASATSALGEASGNASIDFGSERFCLLLAGRPARKRLLQVAAPIRIEGPWLRPSVHVLAGNKARALGLHGALGTVLTPLAGLAPVKGKPPAACF